MPVHRNHVPRHQSGRRTLTMLAALLMMVASLFPVGVTDLAAAPAPDSAQTSLAQADPETAMIDVTAFTCAADALSSGQVLTAADYATACPTPAPKITFHLVQNEQDTTISTNDSGNARFEFPTGETVRFFAGVPLEADETLFCSTGDPSVELPIEITIDAEGVSDFDVNAATTYTCFWYVVDSAAPAATENPAPAATEMPAATEPVVDSTVELFAFECSESDVTDAAAASYDDLMAACFVNPSGVEFNLEAGGQTQAETTDQNGQASFAFPSGGEVDFFAVVPIESSEVLYCSVDQGTPQRLIRDSDGVFHWSNATAQQNTCSWFLIVTPTATEVPTESPATEEIQAEIPATEVPAQAPATEVPADLAQIAISPLTCPDSFDPETSGTDLFTLAANCTAPVSGVSFTLGAGDGATDVRVSSATEPIVWSGLEPGSYTLISSVPLESATEYLGCQADGGALYEKSFSAQGVTSFVDLETEQIACTWYIVPESQRGEVTGASLELHLAVCPVGFTGDSIFETCHSNGLAGFDFTIDGPDGEQTAATAILQADGPGVVTFSSLPAGTYSITGGPPGDFGRVDLYCSTQPDSGTPEYSIDEGVGSLTLGENEHVLCDWYYIPDDNRDPSVTPPATVTPTPTPARAEILVTLLACPSGESGAYGGMSLANFQQRCTEKVDDVTFRLGDLNGVPLTAKTGLSGPGAVRFYDLLPGDLTMNPTLPTNLKSAAIFCTIGSGTPYQKALANGGTTFVGVDGESISCSWFAVKTVTPSGGGETGSITIREYLCEKDLAQIVDWDAECAPGSTGTSFTIANTANGAASTGTPDSKGIHVFTDLSDGFYTLTQGTGRWCRAVADRVDSQSRLIVQGGGNTDVVLYQCNAVNDLPVTGSGESLNNQPVRSDGKPFLVSAGLLFAVSMPLIRVSGQVVQESRHATRTRNLIDMGLDTMSSELLSERVVNRPVWRFR